MPTLLVPASWIEITSSISSRNAWVDINCTGLSPPANVVGAIVYQSCLSSNLSREQFGVRKNGSTDTGLRMYKSAGPNGDSGTQQGKQCFVGLDANKIFEVYWGNGKGRSERIYITGWFTANEAYFFDNAVVINNTLSGVWRSEWVNDATWMTLNMTPAHHPTSGAPAAYLMAPYNGHWSTGHLDFIPAGEQSDRASSCSLTYDTHHTSMVVPAGASGNVEFRSYDPSTNIEVQVFGIITAGFTRATPQFALSKTDTAAWNSYSVSGVPAGAYGLALRTFSSAAGAFTGVRDSNWPGAATVKANPAPYAQRDFSLMDVSTGLYQTQLKWSTSNVVGTFGPILVNLVLATTGLNAVGTVQAKAIAQRCILTCTGLNAARTVQQKAVLHRQTLTAGGLSAAPAVQAKAITHRHALVCTGLNAAKTVQQRAVLVRQTMAATGLNAAGTVQAKAIAQRYLLATTGLSAAKTVQQRAVLHRQTLTVTGLNAVPSVQAKAITHRHALVCTGLNASKTVQQRAVLVRQTLATTGLNVAPAVQAKTITQRYMLAAGGLNATRTVQGRPLAQRAMLAATGLNAAPSVRAAVLAQRAMLAAGGLSGSATVANGALNISFGITSVNDASTGTQPLEWGKPAFAMGKFGTLQGRIFVATVQATVTAWADNRIDFIPVAGGLPPGGHDVHVDVVL